MTSILPDPLGATFNGEGAVTFGAFASPAERCQVQLFDADGKPSNAHDMQARGGGYFSTTVAPLGAGARYKFVVDGRLLPDPYCRFAPEGVHEPASVVTSDYVWRRGRWPHRGLDEQVVYELHIGTFTPAGTYAGAREKLGYLTSLGVTTLELMPLSAFPGQRGWGYDGVMHFAPFAPYGTPDELRRLVDEAHGHGLSVLLDVVYNHFGPSGNYLGAYSPDYFTEKFRNAWGPAPNYQNPVMRRYVVDNALYWLEEFRFDGLRLDATHAIFDPSPVHIVREIAEVARERVPSAVIIAEDERNEPGCVTDLSCDAVWADDFHHHVRVSLTGEQEGYYRGYRPGAAELARVIERGWSYEGQVYPPSGKPRGRSADELEAACFVYCIQNHDQIGNRALGTRLCHEVDLDAYCMMSALLLFLPMTPLLFMGQEWAATSPFLFFTDHDAELGALVTAGRRREFAGFSAFSDPEQQAKIPDPQHPDTYLSSKLHWEEVDHAPHARVAALYRELLALRSSDPLMRASTLRRTLSARAEDDVLMVRRQPVGAPDAYVLIANMGKAPAPVELIPWVRRPWRQLLATSPTDTGTVPPKCAVIVASGSQ